jgi:protein required for attachment to host cells
MNATRARILRGLDPVPDPAAAELVMRTEAHRLKDIMADKPGRSFASHGGGRRSAMAYGSDPLEEDERVFARQVLALLESHRLASDFERLAIIAEPGVLGRLRQEMPARLRELVVAEVPKNLLHLTPRELPEAVLHEIEGAGAKG